MTLAATFSDEALETGRKLCVGPVAFVLGAASLAQLPAGDRPEIAFAGRSNVGKSSLLNAVLNRKSLARSSAEPGKTRELNYFDLGDGKLWLVDLPGFGYAKVSRDQQAK
ncbi:MAG: GTPase, partial [Pseudomonadota bacterium]